MAHSVSSMRLLFLTVFSVGTVLLMAACAESGPLLRDGEANSVGGMGGLSGGPGSGGSRGGQSGSSGIPADCVFRSSEELAVCAGTYLDVEADSWGSVVQLSQGRIVLAAQVSSASGTIAVDETISRSGPGALLVLGQAGRVWSQLIWLGDSAGPLETNDFGLVATWNGREILLLDSSLSLIWKTALQGEVIRLDLALDGTVAVLMESGDVSLWDAQGDNIVSFPVVRPGTSLVEPLVHDVAISHDGSRVYVVGAHEDPSGGCEGMVPFLRAYDRAGQLLSRAYDFDTIEDNCASSEGLRVSVGDDGLVYYAGQNQGGNTVHLLDPKDVSAPAPLVSYDIYNQGFGKAIERYGFVGRFHPETLAIQLGQLLLPRDAEDVGGEFQIREVLADKNGQVAVAARSTCCFPKRESTTLEGMVPGVYGSEETSVVVLGADFLERELWLTPTVVSQGEVSPVGLSWRDQILSIVSRSASESSLFLQEPIQSSPTDLPFAHRANPLTLRAVKIERTLDTKRPQALRPARSLRS